MHLILLAAGVVVALWSAWAYLKDAAPHQRIWFLSFIGLLILAGGVTFLAVTQRLGAALALAFGTVPFLLRLFQAYAFYRRVRAETARMRGRANRNKSETGAGEGPMTRKRALAVLGLPDNAGQDEIRTAYKNLIKKVHPDQGGSAYLAAQLNEAKRVLLKD